MPHQWFQKENICKETEKNPNNKNTHAFKSMSSLHLQLTYFLATKPHSLFCNGICSALLWRGEQLSLSKTQAGPNINNTPNIPVAKVFITCSWD